MLGQLPAKRARCAGWSAWPHKRLDQEVETGGLWGLVVWRQVNCMNQRKKSGENRLRGDCKVWMKPSCATWNDNKRTKDQTIMKQSCNPLVKDFFHRSSQMYLLNRQIASAQHEDLGWKFKPNRYFSFSMHLRFLCLGSPWRSSTEATIGVDLACWDLNWMIIAEFQPGAKCECKIYL